MADSNTKVLPQEGGRPNSGSSSKVNKPSQAKPLGHGGGPSERFTGPNDNMVKDEAGFELNANGYKGVDPIYQHHASILDSPAGS